MKRMFVIAVALGAAAGGQAQHRNEHDPRALAVDPLATDGVQIAPVLEGLGDNHHPVTTKSERAQSFFDQGLELTYAFNHQEALRSFKEAVRLDPECAMAYWGWALVLGPNLNLPMQPDVVPQAYEAVQKAVSLRDLVTEQERAYIDALAARYAPEARQDRGPLDAAYAEGMARLHALYPEDNDGATLYAAALMNLSPWNYWNKDGSPRPDTSRLLSVLEDVIAREPQHEGALHYYIHATESVVPQKAEKAADLLDGLTPGAGHLVHMPSHIYMRVGRYGDAFDANVKAVQADEGYITACRNQGIYPLAYYPHNIHFLAWAAILQGKKNEALAASTKVAERVPHDMHGDNWALYQTFLSMPLYTMVRFGLWKEILEEPKPREDAIYLTGIWHYARGLAFVFGGRLPEASRELSAIESIEADPEAIRTLIGYANARRLLRIARNVLAGELLAKEGDFDAAVGHLDRAVRLEDGLLYGEPPDWYYPVRHSLGAVLLDAGRPDEAEVVYWDDLKRNPENGYSLRGLADTLEAQGREEEAHQIEERFCEAWKDADVMLMSSRF